MPTSSCPLAAQLAPDLDRRGARPRACRRCRPGRRSCWACALGVGLERLGLVVEGHHPAVRVGAAHRDAEAACRRARSRSRAQPPTYAARLAAARRRCPARAAARTRAPARRARRAQTRAALVAISVWKLTMLSSAVSRSWRCSSGPAHAHQRLVREDHRPLGDGVDVAGAARIPARWRGTPARTAAGRRCRSASRGRRGRRRRSGSSSR